MKNSYKNIFFCYSFSYFTLLVGLFLNEDFAFGYIRDYELHKKAIDIFDNGFINGLLNYEEKKIPHSPIYLYYFSLLQNLFNNEVIAKLINIHISLLIPLFAYKGLSIRIIDINKSYISLLPVIFFISPYFRSGAIWIDDNLLALVFLSISIYFFILYKKNDKLIYIFYNTLFLALAAYVRPIYCLLSFYFFFQYFLVLNSKNKIFYYIIFNIILSFPAIYYVFILEINDWFENYLFRGNIITVLALTISIIIFYLLPYLFFYLKNNKTYSLNIIESIFLIIFTISLFLFFKYELNYSGGIFYKLSRLIFDNNLLFFLISILCFLYLFKLLTITNELKKKVGDIIIVLILILLEFDGIIYHETYDPLIYLLIFLIFENYYIKDFIFNLSKLRLISLLSFSSLFYITSIIKTMI